ncbi:MAG: hypothetical protein GY803_11365 [Chloroflexi bacterium]|nr:hypothetical protein [Chloroflexota bacterium]
MLAKNAVTIPISSPIGSLARIINRFSIQEVIQVVLSGHTGRVLLVAVTADGNRAVSALWDKTLQMWDLAAGQEPNTLSGLG